MLCVCVCVCCLQGIVWILGGVTVAVNILNVVLHIIFIYGAGMGFRSVDIHCLFQVCLRVYLM